MNEVKWPRFEIIRNDAWSIKYHPPLYYWHLKARNGNIIADGGQGYSSKSNCRRALKRLHTLLGPSLPIIDKTNE